MKNIKAWFIYGGATLAITLPLMTPGFILTLDWVFVPQLPMPQDITSSFLFHAALHILNTIIPSDVLQKIILLAILLLSSFGLHYLIRTITNKKDMDWGIYVASLFFAVNPFTYSRFMAGQYAVLLGYALLPWIARQLVLLARYPTLKNALLTGLLASLIGIVSIHTTVAVVILAVTGFGILLFRHRSGHGTYLKYGVITAACFLVLSSYWIVPLALGQSKTATTINSFTAADTTAFATIGDNPLEKLFHVLRLQGFWAEARRLYLLPQEKIIGWGLMIIGLVGLAITGAMQYRKRRKTLVLWFGGSALIGVLLAIGIGSELIPGLREPHKLIMLLALFYSIFLAAGVNYVLERLLHKSETLYSAGAVVLFAVPAITMAVMWWGFHGQLSPRHYPSDWTMAKTQLSTDNGRGNILFLPWHQYMTFEFAGRVIANPASAFFGERAIISQDPELEGATSGNNTPQLRTITQLLAQPDTSIAQKLADQNIRYIVLAKELDYNTYGFVAEQSVFELVQEYPTLLIYKNAAWKQP